MMVTLHFFVHFIRICRQILYFCEFYLNLSKRIINFVLTLKLTY